MMTLNKTIKKLIYVLVILIPLWFLPITTNAIEFNKQALMILLVVIILVLWLVKTLRQGEIGWKSNILNIFIGAFLVIAILSTIFSLHPYGSLVGWPTHLSGSLINILAFIGLYILIINNFKGLKETFNLLFAFLVSSGLAGLVGLIQLWGGFIFPWDFTKTASFNTIGTANTLGIFSAIILIIVTALLFVIKRNNTKLLLIIIGIISFIILLSLNFWVLWSILILGMTLILLFGLIKLVRLEESISWIALPMVILAVSLILLVFRPALPFSPNLPIEVGLSHRGGFDIIERVITEEPTLRPILGSGPETFAINYSQYKPETINQTMFWNVNFSNPPAEIFSVVSDLGILGLLSFLCIIVLFIAKAIKNLNKTIDQEDNVLKRFLEIGLFAGWLSLAVAWFLYPQNFTLMFVFWLLLALYLAESSVFKDKVYDLKKSSKALLMASFSFVVLVIIIVGFLYIGGTRYVAEAKYKRGLDLIRQKGELDKGINTIARATITNPYEDRTYRVLSQLFILKLDRDRQLGNLTQQERVNIIQVDAVNAINSAVRATILSPKDVSNWLTRAQVYHRVMGFVNGADDWAEDSYEKADELGPNNPFIFTEWGRFYADKYTLNKNESFLEAALEKFNKAVELKPDYAPAHFETALVFDRQGKLDQAISKMETNFRLSPDTGRAFQLGVLYYKAERYDQAKAAFIWATSQSPDYSNARYFLGLLYDRENNKEDALDQFERIAKLNPDNDHVKEVIANLKAGLPALGSPDLGPPDQPEEIPIEKTPTEQ